MKQTFLSKLAENIVASGISLSDTLIVLPNRRAQRMLLKALANCCEKPIFAPTFFTINDFIDSLSPLEKLDKVALMVRLYECYRQLAGEDADDFSTALAWMPAFVDDMSEVDKQLDDAQLILKELAYAKDFEIPFGKEEISVEAERKIRFFNLLSDLYLKFRETLTADGLAYDGLVYRDCAEHIDDYQEKLTYKHYVFAGFHVLNPAELAVVKFLKEHFDTHFYFDIDPFYCDFNKNERYTTAHFLHKICETLSLPKESIRFSENCYETIPKQVSIVGTSKEMNQIFYAIQCLEEIKTKQGNLDDTALVLADENLLVPLLSAYDVSEANVTMGYPFTASPAYTLLETLLDMYQTGLGYHRNGAMRFHRRDVLTLLHSPLIKNYLFEDKKRYYALLENIEIEQRSLYSAGDLKEVPLPTFCTETADLLISIKEYVNIILEKVVERFPDGGNQDQVLLQMLVEQLDLIQEQLKPLAETGTPLTLSVIKFAVRQQIGGLTLPIKGDATKGLQILGLLETRTLDFKNVIMLSVNEGVLPSGITFNSIIPFDFKFHDETLENYLYKDQVYAYHFFRLLQRAERVVLLYNNNCTGSLVEKSRFVTQLEFEVRERHLGNIQIDYPAVAFPYQVSASEEIKVEKTPEILNQLYHYKYSASALKTYINCPLQFYLKHVCHIKPPTTFKDRIESNVIGTVVHAVFEHLFDVSVEKEPDFAKRIDEYLENLDENIRQLILNDEELQKTMPLRDTDLTHGRVYLALCMVRNHVRSYLEKAKVELQGVTVVDNELELDCRLRVGEHDLTLHGFIDRLQKRDGHLEVIDYKTGHVDGSKLRVAMNELDVPFGDPAYEKFLQLLFYALLCKYSKDERVSEQHCSEPPQCAIISIQEANTGDDYIHKAVLVEEHKGRTWKNPTESFKDEYLDKLESALKELLLDIINPEENFKQTDDVGRCGYCDFKHLCNR